MTTGDSAHQTAQRGCQQGAPAWRVPLPVPEADSVAAVLDQLVEHAWLVRHDVHWPGRTRARVEHVALGAQGLFVLASAEGVPTVERGVLRVDGRRRGREVAAVANAAAAVRGVLGADLRDHVTPVLCFEHDEALQAEVDGVLVVSRANLLPVLLSRPALVEAGVVKNARRDLARALPRAGSRAATAYPPGRPPRAARLSKGRERRARRALGLRVIGAVLLAGLVIGLTPVIVPGAWSTLGDALTSPLTGTDDVQAEGIDERPAGTPRQHRGGPPAAGRG